MEADQVGLRLAGVLGEDAVNLLKVGGGDFGGVLADLNLGDDGPVVPLNGGQLVDAAEHRLRPGGNQPLAHAKGVDPRPLADQIPDNILIQGVGGHDLALLQARRVQHLPGLLRQVGQIPRVQPDAALGDAHRRQHLLKGLDGVGHAGLQHVVGVHQKGGVVGVELAVGLKGGVLVGEHLHPGVGHGAGGGGAVPLVRHGAGGGGAAGDIAGPRPQQRAVRPLGPAGTELSHRPALGGPDNPVGLGGDQGLVVQGQQDEGLYKLGLDRRGPHGHNRLVGEDRGALGDRPDVAGEFKVLQKGQKRLAEAPLGAQIGHVLLVEAQLLDVLHHLGQAGGDGKAPLVGDGAVEHVEVTDAVL